MTMSSGLSLEGGVVSQGSLALRPSIPDTFVRGMMFVALGLGATEGITAAGTPGRKEARRHVHNQLNRDSK